MDKITVVVPCFNEEAVIPTFYKKMSDISDELSGEAVVELLFVDDGSSDGTLELLEALSDEDTYRFRGILERKRLFWQDLRRLTEIL